MTEEEHILLLPAMGPWKKKEQGIRREEGMAVETHKEEGLVEVVDTQANRADELEREESPLER
jgi:hypothetical protein